MKFVELAHKLNSLIRVSRRDGHTYTHIIQKLVKTVAGNIDINLHQYDIVITQIVHLSKVGVLLNNAQSDSIFAQVVYRIHSSSFTVTCKIQQADKIMCNYRDTLIVQINR